MIESTNSDIQAGASDGRQLRPRRHWWILLTVILLTVAGVSWLRTPRLDPRLYGAWTFLAIDNSGIRRFLTLSPDGTADFTESRPGAVQPARVVPNPMRWWVEGDVLAVQQVRNAQTTAMQMVQDAIRAVRMKKPVDRTDFRLKILSAEPHRLHVRVVIPGASQPPELEMTRAEKPE